MKFKNLKLAKGKAALGDKLPEVDVVSKSLKLPEVAQPKLRIGRQKINLTGKR